MQLRTFITQALLDIVHGVADAQAESGEASIVPHKSVSRADRESGITEFQMVKFQVSVRVDESKGSEGKIGVVSSILGASMAGKSSNESEHTTTLQFSVPILLPVQETKKSS